MFQYRQVLVRLRAGDTVREIARSGLMGRDKLGELHAVAQSQGWLDAGADVPDDQAIIAALGPARRASSTVSSAEPHRAAVKAWLQAGVQGRAIHAALKREHAYMGLRDDAVPLAPPVRRIRVGPGFSHLAGLPPPSLRVVRRRAWLKAHRPDLLFG